ncbi:MAG: AmmeMemoRadiSam system radical SAM enzyme [Kiritimatiellaeota bacterium]|nr:AmmeMemoRadiSam system radical SAM enzyme [Kiritimatiellota bacterium]
MPGTNDTSFPTKYWQALPDGRVQCDTCPHHCKLLDGQRGICFVRACRNGQIVLTTYGRSSGFCIDPIEKKPLNHFLPGTAILSFGTAGCNLNCKFCQNWHLSRSREVETLAVEATPEAIARATHRLGCRSVAFTYNDPVVFLEYAVDVARACHAVGVQTVAVTAGYICAEPRRDFYAHMDAANVDLKGFTDDFYRKFCGAQLQPVLETLVYLARETKVWFEITTLLIPGENDSETEVDALTQWIARELGPHVPLHFTAFYPAWQLTGRRPTPPATLQRARQIALKNGLHYVFTGNVRDPAGAATYCPGCGRGVIGRDGYQIAAWHLSEGARCAFCAAPIAGVFEAQPGAWHGACAPVDIGAFAPPD